MFLDKDEKAVAVFAICIEHHNKASNRKLGFTSAR